MNWLKRRCMYRIPAKGDRGLIATYVSSLNNCYFYQTTMESVDSRRNLVVVRTGQDKLMTYSPSRLETATNDATVYRLELQPISQGERIRISGAIRS